MLERQPIKMLERKNYVGKTANKNAGKKKLCWKDSQ